MTTQKYVVNANVYGGCGEYYTTIVAKGSLSYCKKRCDDFYDNPDEYRGVYIEKYIPDSEEELEDF
jgi:hypothetical protein